jgi:hypothetical protein
MGGLLAVVAIGAVMLILILLNKGVDRVFRPLERRAQSWFVVFERLGRIGHARTWGVALASLVGLTLLAGCGQSGSGTAVRQSTTPTVVATTPSTDESPAPSTSTADTPVLVSAIAVCDGNGALYYVDARTGALLGKRSGPDQLNVTTGIARTPGGESTDQAIFTPTNFGTPTNSGRGCGGWSWNGDLDEIAGIDVHTHNGTTSGGSVVPASVQLSTGVITDWVAPRPVDSSAFADTSSKKDTIYVEFNPISGDRWYVGHDDQGKGVIQGPHYSRSLKDPIFQVLPGDPQPYQFLFNSSHGTPTLFIDQSGGSPSLVGEFLLPDGNVKVNKELTSGTKFLSSAKLPTSQYALIDIRISDDARTAAFVTPDGNDDYTLWTVNGKGGTPNRLVNLGALNTGADLAHATFGVARVGLLVIP